MPSLLNLKYSLRSLKQNKFTLFINILGFSVSLAFVIMIGLYVQKEYSVDSFHKDKERIFMLEAPVTWITGFSSSLWFYGRSVIEFSANRDRSEGDVFTGGGIGS